jgi:hypothetical protein
MVNMGFRSLPQEYWTDIVASLSPLQRAVLASRSEEVFSLVCSHIGYIRASNPDLVTAKEGEVDEVGGRAYRLVGERQYNLETYKDKDDVKQTRRRRGPYTIRRVPIGETRERNTNATESTMWKPYDRIPDIIVVIGGRREGMWRQDDTYHNFPVDAIAKVYCELLTVPAVRQLEFVSSVAVDESLLRQLNLEQTFRNLRRIRPIDCMRLTPGHMADQAHRFNDMHQRRGIRVELSITQPYGHHQFETPYIYIS